MMPMLTALTLAIATPATAHGFPAPVSAPAPTPAAKECCAKMKAAGKECCCEDMAKGEHDDHGAHGDSHNQHQH